MSSKNNGNEVSFIQKVRRWQWSDWLIVLTLTGLWCYAIYEIIGYVMRG